MNAARWELGQTIGAMFFSFPNRPRTPEPPSDIIFPICVKLVADLIDTLCQATSGPVLLIMRSLAKQVAWRRTWWASFRFFSDYPQKPSCPRSRMPHQSTSHWAQRVRRPFCHIHVFAPACQRRPWGISTALSMDHWPFTFDELPNQLFE